MLIDTTFRHASAATKSVSFSYAPSAELSSLFEDFRAMCNDAIRIATQNQPRNRFKLIEFAYGRLKEYGLHTHYVLAACEVAYSVYRSKNRKGMPYIKRAFIKLDNQAYQLNHLLLRIPTSPRHYVFLTLHGSERHLSFMNEAGLKRGSVTITETSVIIPFHKEAESFEPSGHIGIDINERNVTISAANGFKKRFDELGEVVEIKEMYRGIRAKIAKSTRGDRRIAKDLLAKYGRRERNRTIQRIHKITKEIVSHAKEHKFGIKMEKLRGMRRLYRRGSGQGASFRGRMNSWVFGEIQRQVDYKARWDGVPVWYVNPRGTSSFCLCGSRVVRLADRNVYCPKCDKTWDRDDLASKNVVACAVPQDRPSKRSHEGERGDVGSSPPSRWREVSSPGAGPSADRTRGQYAVRLPILLS